MNNDVQKAPMIKLEYTPTFSETVASFSIACLESAVTFPILLIALMVELFSGLHSIHGSAFTLMPITAVLLYIALKQASTYFAIVRKPWEVQLTPHVVAWRRNGAAVFAWSQIYRLSRTKHLLVLGLSPNSSEAICVPLRVVGDEAQQKAFVDTCFTFWKEARSRALSVQHQHFERSFEASAYYTYLAAITLVLVSLIPGGILFDCIPLVFVVATHVANSPSSRARRNENGRKLLAQKKFPEAIKEVAPLIAGSPERTPLVHPFALAAWAQCGLHRFDEAIALADQMLLREPENLHASYIKTVALLNKRQPTEALQQMSLDLSVIPPDFQENVLATKIWALADTDQVSEAISLGTVARSAFPQNAYIMLNLTYAHIINGEYAAALKQLDSFASLPPEAQPESHRLRATCALALNNLPLFHSSSFKAFAADPTDSKVVATHALSLFLDGHPVQALSLVITTIELDPYCAEAFWVRNYIRTTGGGTADAADAEALAKLHYKNYIVLPTSI